MIGCGILLMIIPPHPSDETIRAILMSYGLYRIDINHGVMYDSLYTLVHDTVEEIDCEKREYKNGA
jgi:hypothetical protein